MKLIYGTANSHKKQQVEEFFNAVGINIEILDLKDIGFNEEIIEDGKTFEENSMIKAKTIYEYCKNNNIKGFLVTDDSGLCVDCLNGEPGIYSARYAGDHAPQEIVLKKLLDNIEKTGDKTRSAKFVCVLTVVLENGEFRQIRGETLGRISNNIGPLGKLTYGPVFIPEGFNRVMNELKPEELGTTYREKAFMKLIEMIG